MYTDITNFKTELLLGWCYLFNLLAANLRKNLAWWAVTRRTSKTTELSKLDGGGLCGDECLP